MDPMQGEVGQRIGDYEILGTLGAGGMGRVYRVRHVISERVEAMKILLPGLVGRKESADRFLREIKLVASLNHPNIASLCTALIIDDQLIMVMEFVDGVTFSQLIESGPIRVDDALDYMDQALRALGYAHSKSIIHRDIKPSNMMLTASGVAKLMDFGIARAGTDLSLTQSGTTIGSIAYMSPEQIRGEIVDQRSDLYSIGVSFYEMLTGQLPFAGAGAHAMMDAHLKETPRNPVDLQPRLPSRLGEVIIKSMAKAPGDRFPTAEAFREALVSAVSYRPPTSASQRVGAETVMEGRPAGTVEERIPSTMLINVGYPDRAMTQVVPTPAYGVPRPAELAVKGKELARRRMYYAVGGVIFTVGVIAVPLLYRSHSQGSRDRPDVGENHSILPQTLPPASPKVPVATQLPPQAKTDRAPVPRAGPTQMKPASTVVIAGAASVVVAPPSARAQTPPAMSPEKKAQLDDLETQIDQLESRAAAVNNSLNNMQRTMQKDGMGMRGDIVARQASMNTNLQKTKEAFALQDVDRATRFEGLTSSDLTQLESFLGR